MNNIHYLETSAVNLLADELDDFNFNQLLQKVMKFDFCISSIVIWEIMLNSDKSRMEKLIYWIQFNCANYLLKSPTEIVMSYLSAGCPEKDKKMFWNNRKSTLPLAATWTNIHKKVDRTLIIDFGDIKERSGPIRQLSKMHKSLINAMTDKDEDGYEHDFFHRMMFVLFDSLGRNAVTERADEKLIKTSLMLAFFFICIGVELDNSPVRDYWQPKGLEDPLDRLEYLVKNEPSIIVRGPIIEMALMVEAQTEIEKSSNRGMLFDSLHAIYFYYADNIISNDPHFTVLKQHRKSDIFNGIVPASYYIELVRKSYEMLTSQ